jgi:hypothetical protein
MLNRFLSLLSTAQEHQSEGICSRALSFLKRVFTNGGDDAGERDISQNELVIRSMQASFQSGCSLITFHLEPSPGLCG